MAKGRVPDRDKDRVLGREREAVYEEIALWRVEVG